MLRENRPTSKKVYCRASNINHARTGMAMGSQFQQDICPDTIATLEWPHMTKISELFKVENMELATWMFFSAMSAMFSWVSNQPLLFRWPLPGFGHVFGQDSPKKKPKTSGSESAMPAFVGLPGNCCGGGAWLVRICLNQYLCVFDDLFEYFDDIIWCFFLPMVLRVLFDDAKCPNERKTS